MQPIVEVRPQVSACIRALQEEGRCSPRAISGSSPDVGPPRLRALRSHAVEGALMATRSPAARPAPAPRQ